ncbi:MAG TPA: hypothetical protein VGN83_25720 [Falsiroseomonas sp.]|jgi:hypothetical protein|nr:hypothetical protein [Falsiroseomonas sp.]
MAPELQERVQRLAAFWRVVVSRPPHPVGCTCMGHMLVPAMNARDMEADILDYMRSRYAADGINRLVALLDARAAAREATGIPAQPFRAWLLRLPEAGIEPAVLDRFTADLLATLESFEANSRGTPGGGLFCT